MKDIYFVIVVGAILLWPSNYGASNFNHVVPATIINYTSMRASHTYNYEELMKITPEQEQNLKTILTYCYNPYCIDNFVENSMHYKFNWWPNKLSNTLNTMTGDCSDYALMKCKMLTMANYTCVLLHGYANGNKHDFVGWYDSNMILTYEYLWYQNLTVEGEGLW